MRRYSYSTRQQIINHYHNGVSPSVLCKEYHIPESTLFYWIKKYSSGKMPPVTDRPFSDWAKAMAHIRKIEAELKFLQRTVIKECSLREKMAIVDKEYGKESLRTQCAALELNRSSYLNHQRRNKKEKTWFKIREAELSKIILDIYERSGHIYGSAKIAAIMQKDGRAVSRDYVRRIMGQLGLRSKRSSLDKDYRKFAFRCLVLSHTKQRKANFLYPCVDIILHEVDIDQESHPSPYTRTSYINAAFLISP